MITVNNENWCYWYMVSFMLCICFMLSSSFFFFFFFQAEDGIRDLTVTGVQTCALPISSSNGHEFKNGGKHTCVETAFAHMADGEDVLDALIAGVNILELDPAETSVGYGGLPNAEDRKSVV